MQLLLQGPACLLLAVVTSTCGAGSGAPPSEPEGQAPPLDTYPTEYFPVRADVGFYPRSDTFLPLPDRVTEDWQEQVRRRLSQLLSPRPESWRRNPEATPLSPIDVELPSGVSMEVVQLSMSDGVRLRTALLTPREPIPDVLVMAFHGHAETLEGLFDPESHTRALAPRLAAVGFRVMAVESRSWGHSDFSPLTHTAYANRLRLQGREYHGEAVSDHAEALTHALAAFGLPATSRVGVAGCSLGGLSSLFLSVLDPRIDVALISGGAGSWTHSFASLQHYCTCSHIAGLLRHMDAPHLLAATHAETLAIEEGIEDGSLGVVNNEGVREEVVGLSQRGAAVIGYHRHPGGHHHDIEFVTSFFRQVLPHRGRADPPVGPES